MMGSFTTQFGHEIEFVPGYFDRNKNYIERSQAGASKLGYRTELGAAKSTDGSRLGFASPAKDLVEFSAMVYFMDRFGLLRRRKHGIDLGGAEGTCISLFKAAGHIEHATNLDLVDYSQVTGDGYFDDFIAYVRDLDSKNDAEAESVRQAIRRGKIAFDYFPQQSLSMGVYDQFPNCAGITENLHMDVYSATGKYDLVTAFACLEHLDLELAFPKIRELMTDDGSFVCLDAYWWWAMNSSGVIGHFPYVAQRLSFPDLQRYVIANHPEYAAGLSARYFHVHEGQQHPTLNDWFGLARKHGLRPIAVERIVPKHHHRLKDCPPAIFAESHFNHQEVLRDIHYLKPDVTVDDLFTSAFFIAMIPL
jgi:hypothetical protein